MHIMIDNETLGTGPNAPIIQIGARLFQLRTVPSGATRAPTSQLLGADFLVNISAQDLMIRYGYWPEKGTTHEWWPQQDEKVVMALSEGPAPVPAINALHLLNDFLKSSEDANGPIEGVWANGDVFDIGGLRELYHRCGMQEPWDYNKPRDGRTLFHAARELAGWERPQREVFHNGAKDATDQALDVIDAWSWLANRHARLGEGPIEIVTKLEGAAAPAAPRPFGPVGTGHR